MEVRILRYFREKILRGGPSWGGSPKWHEKLFRDHRRGRGSEREIQKGDLDSSEDFMRYFR